MNQDNYPRSDWYAPRRAPQPQPQPRPQPQYRPQPQKKKHTGMKVTAITLCVLLLIVASVYAFSDALDGGWTFRQREPDSSHSFTFEIPGPGDSDTPQDDGGATMPEDYDEDYKDFFTWYYPQQEADTTERSNIERGGTGADFRLTLQSVAGRDELTLQELYTRCVESVVGIKTTQKGKVGYYWGTGIIMSEDGFILTNQHLVAGTNQATVILPDGTETPALLVGEDAQMDLAVLKVEAEGLHAAEFGNSSELRVGDSVVAIGNPLMDSLSGTMTNGIVSAIDRSVSSNGHPMTLIQTNAAINEGNSGGPLFNMYGQVVGITNMKMVNTYSEVTVEGIGFAIPSVTAKAVSDQLIATGSYVRPGIGITVGPIDSADAEHYGLPSGLYITSVSESSDAAAKGVKAGDILTHVNGIPVRKTDDVISIRDSMQIGDIMTLTIYRNGETLEFQIELFDLGKLY